jgi:hypothetical protein
MAQGNGNGSQIGQGDPKVARIVIDFISGTVNLQVNQMNCTPIHLWVASQFLNRMANKMEDQGEMRQAQDQIVIPGKHLIIP